MSSQDEQPTAPQASPPLTPKKGRFKRWALRTLLITPVLMLALWIAIHRIPGLAPVLANSLRAVIGADAVTWLEETAYAWQDRWNRLWRSNEAPKAHWEVPSAAPSQAPPIDAGPAEVDAGPPPISAFLPKDVGPVHQAWSAPGDGKWVPIVDLRQPEAAPVLFKTLLHPDRNRSWAEVFVVAADLRQVKLHAVAGWQEPKSHEVAGKKYQRTAKIPEADHELLLAAFNGGFKTEHGWYGMKVDGVTLVKPRATACTIAQYDDGYLKLATWKAVEASEPQMLWWRQTPACMYEDGKLHPGLHSNSTTAWGATLDGETVIRRSAIGLDSNAEILYVAITNDTTARALADGMFHAGAASVAQLDVNWSYPKFLLYQPKEASTELEAVPLAKGFEYTPDEYVRSRAMRDFFYLTKREKANLWRPEASPPSRLPSPAPDAGAEEKP